MSIGDVVIIGAGPAGLTAALELKRNGFGSIILEKDEIGGLLRNANLVENYPGFPGGIPGSELIKLFEKQINHAGVRVHFEEVLELDYRKGVFSVKTDRRTITCHIAVIASGTKPRTLSNLEIPTDSEKRIFYEIHSLTHVTDENIAIIGSGDLAFDYALNLSKKNEIVIFNRGKRVKCLPLLWGRAEKNKKISYKEETQVKKIKLHDAQLILTCKNIESEWETAVSYLVVAIGRKPYLDFLSDHLRENLESLQTRKLLYMIGDVKNNRYRQTAIAVGDGIKSVMDICQTMKGEEICE